MQSKGDIMGESIVTPDSVSQKIIGFFRVPGLFVRLNKKGILDSDSNWSPTSILDFKSFSNYGSFSDNSPVSNSPKVGLSLIHSLSDESSSANFGCKKVFFGPELKLNTPSLKLDLNCQSERNEQISSPMLIDEIAQSEDYTCVTSHGNNPRITHDVGEYLFQANGDQLSYDRNKEGESGIFSFCCSCYQTLREGKDIYMYRGEKAFCSSDCREIFIAREIEDEPMIDASNSAADSSFDDGRIFQPINY